MHPGIVLPPQGLLLRTALADRGSLGLLLRWLLR